MAANLKLCHICPCGKGPLTCPRNAVGALCQVLVQHLDNPRVELEDHYYNAKATHLLDLGLQPHYLSDTLISSLMVKAKEYAQRARRDTIMPWVNWRATSTQPPVGRPVQVGVER